jgi:hypothetical protein
MKKILVVALMSIGLSNVFAQVNTNTPPLPTSSSSFFETAQNWLTSFNTNNDWNSKGEMSIGVASLSNYKDNLVNDIRVGYDVFKVVSLEGGFRDTGFTGKFISAQGGLGVNVRVYDAKVTFYADGGYAFEETKEKAYGELGVRISKKMTKYTFIGVSMGEQLPRNSRVFSAYTGFTF